MAVPISVLADSYKATHYLQYPDSIKVTAYSEFRQSFDKDTEDERIVVFGIRYLVEKYLQQRWTTADVEMASDFFRSHLAPNFAEFPFPKELFVKFIEQNDGYFPVKVQALRDGTCIHPHVPVFQITAEGEWAPLCTYLETILSHVWYPSTVATLSRRTRQLIEDAFDRAVPDGRNSILVPSKLVDFGFRGCTCVEQAVLGGTAHLLNFSASDTMPASFYAQFHLNNGKPVGSSIPATEHSVMTSWPSERDAMENMIERFGTGIFACVMDSYDYAAALSEALPAVAAKKVEKGGFIVLRPDSGDPTEAVLMGLRAAEKVFGATSNAKGYKSPVNAGVIQGDGVSYATIRKILDSVIEEGFSPEAVSFGMGAGLLQKVNRDTLSFATKLSHIVYADGMKADKMKYPVTDRGKISMPGELAVKRVDGIPTVFPKDSGLVPPEEDLLETVYDCGPVEGIRWQTFDEMQGRVNCEWRSLPRTHDVLSQPLKQKIDKELKAIGKSARYS